MKRAAHIFLLLVSAALLTTSCNQQAEDITLGQMERTVSFLTSTHTPRLICEDDLADYPDDNTPPQFYSVFGRASYRYIVNYYDDGRDARPEVWRGCTITMTFAAYDFSAYRAPTLAQLYATNDPALRDAMANAGWTLDDDPFFAFEPVTVTLGKGELIRGVEMALEGCREGDEVEIWSTSSLAYSGAYIGILNKDIPVYWHIVINSVEQI